MLLNPLSLIDSSEFNNYFFEKIDEIENLIINESNYKEIVKKYNLKSNSINLVNINGNNVNGVHQRDIKQILLTITV